MATKSLQIIVYDLDDEADWRALSALGLKPGSRSYPIRLTTDTTRAVLETIGIFGSYGGIQHFWSGRFRSNLVYGYVNADNPGFVSGDTFDNTNYVAADLIWNPYKEGHSLH